LQKKPCIGGGTLGLNKIKELSVPASKKLGGGAGVKRFMWKRAAG